MTAFAQYMFCSFILGGIGYIIDKDNNGSQKLSYYGATLKLASVIYLLGSLLLSVKGTVPAF